MAAKFGRAAEARQARLFTSTSSSRSSRTCATRATSSPSTSTRTPICASPRRSTTSIRRSSTAADLAAALAPAQRGVPRGLVHDRLALLARALARDREGAARQPPRRHLRRDRRAARPRRVPARRRALPPAGRGLLRPHRGGRCGADRSDGATGGCRRRIRHATGSQRADFAAIAGWIAHGLDACSTWAAATARCCATSATRGASPATASRSTTTACSRA